MFTNFPNGLSSFGMPLIGSGPLLTYGNVFFVQSTHVNASNGNKGTSPDRPLATIDYAIGLCTANNNDHIIVGPTHVETITAAGGVRFDVAGITVIGLGTGSSRPQINYTTSTAAEMSVNAANTTLHNLLFTGGIDALASPLDVNATDFLLSNCEYRDVTGQATDFLILRSGADRARILNHVHRGAAAAGANAAIALTGPSNVLIQDFLIDGNFAVGAIDFRTTASTDVIIRRGMVRQRNSSDIVVVDTITASTGIIGPDIFARVADNAANITEAFTGATFVYMQPLRLVNNAGESSMDTNITASTDA